MRDVHDQDSEIGFRATLSLAVLAVAITCANVSSLPIDGNAFAARLADPAIRKVFAAGFTLQIATSTWLALSLLLDVRRTLRAALYSWFASLVLLLSPVPTIAQDAGAAVLPLIVVALAALVGWALDDSLRERTA